MESYYAYQRKTEKTDRVAWFRYTIRQFNNMINDNDGFDIYEKFFMLGLDKTREYMGDGIADKLLYVHGLVNDHQKWLEMMASRQRLTTPRESARRNLRCKG